MTPYRTSPHAPETAILAFPREARPSQRGGIGLAAFALAMFALVGLACGALFKGDAGLTYGALVGTLLAIIVIGIFRALARRAPSGIEIRVVGRTLTFVRSTPTGNGTVLAKASLDELLDVAMDRREIAPMPGVRLPSFGQDVQPVWDEEATLLFHFRDRDEPLRLTQEDLLEVVTVDEFASIRRFLRTQGWRPLDEREADRDNDAAPR